MTDTEKHLSTAILKNLNSLNSLIGGIYRLADRVQKLEDAAKVPLSGVN